MDGDFFYKNNDISVYRRKNLFKDLNNRNKTKIQDIPEVNAWENKIFVEVPKVKDLVRE